MRAGLVGRVRASLAQAGFAISEQTPLRPSNFDVIARRDGTLYIIKVLTNVDALSVSVAREMRILAKFLDAKPLLVGLRSSAGDLARAAIYVRHGVPIMEPDTFDDFILEGVPPLVTAAPGGFYVALDGTLLRKMREDRGLSLGQIADVAGVSRRAISMYEEGMSAMVAVAERLEAFFDAPLVASADPHADRTGATTDQPDDPLSRFKEGLERDLADMLHRLGFSIVPTGRSPFDALSRVDKTTLLTAFPSERGDLEARASLLRSLTEVTERHGLFLVRAEERRTSITGTPIVRRDELNRMDEPEQLVDLVRERRDASNRR